MCNTKPRDMKYVGDNKSIKDCYGDAVFHCIENIINIETMKMGYLIRVPLIHGDEVVYPAGMSGFYIDEETLYRDFKYVDGDKLEDIIPEDETNMEFIKEIADKIDNLSDEDIENLFSVEKEDSNDGNK